MWKITASLGCGLILGWLIRHYFKPGLKSDTTRFLRQSGTKLSYYTMPTLVGTLLVSGAALAVALDTVSEFLAMEEKGLRVTERHYQKFRIKIAIAVVGTWYAFINPSWQKAKQDQKDATKPPIPLG